MENKMKKKKKVTLHNEKFISEKLTGCPNCGSKDLLDISNHNGYHIILCQKCASMFYGEPLNG